MRDVLSLLDRIAYTPSRNEKMAILKDNKDSDLLKSTLEYVYNPYKVYGIGHRAFKATKASNEFTTIFELFDYLLKYGGTSDIAKEKVNAFLKDNESDAYWYRKMFLKDLKIGITATTINKVWPGLIPSFDVMLAFLFDRITGPVAIEPKIDGCRCIAIKRSNVVSLYTRNGKPITGFTALEDDIRRLPVEYMVFDGEIAGSNYKDTMNKLFSHGKDKQATYMIFDILTLQEFQRGFSKVDYLTRKKVLLSLESLTIESKIPVENLSFVAPMEIQENPTIESLKALMDKAVELGFEGIMIKGLYSGYTSKRSYDWQKMKPFRTNEFRIIDFEEGEDRLAGMLGKVIVDVDGIRVGVGSGFSDDERKFIWSHRKECLGRLIEVQYSRILEDSGSLLFPTVRGFRYDIT